MKITKMIMIVSSVLLISGCGVGSPGEREVKDTFLMSPRLHLNEVEYVFQPSSVTVRKTETENVWEICWDKYLHRVGPGLMVNGRGLTAPEVVECKVLFHASRDSKGHCVLKTLSILSGASF